MNFSLVCRFQFDAWVLHRFTQVFFQSSWMVLLFGGAFIWIFLYLCQVPLLVQIAGVLVFAGLCSFPIMISSFLCMVLVKVFPGPQGPSGISGTDTVVLVSSVILIFRYLEPEKYIGPGGLERFRGLVDLIDTRRQPWNPAIWASNTLSAWGQQAYRESLPHFLKLLALFSFLLTGLLATARLIYRRSWDRALQSLSGEGDLVTGRTRLSWISKHLSHSQWSQEIRELVLFLRDPSQWSQVFVLLALLGLYLFSITKVTENLLGATNYTMALLNTIFVTFISLSISSRFVFTSFSADGQAIWLMKTAPDGWMKFMRGKLLVFGLPCLGFSLVLGLLSGVILQLNAEQLLVIGLFGFWDSLFMVLMALGFGMFFINPTVENPLKLIVSPGGLLLMLVGVFFAAPAPGPALNRTHARAQSGAPALWLAGPSKRLCLCLFCRLDSAGIADFGVPSAQRCSAFAKRRLFPLMMTQARLGRRRQARPAGFQALNVLLQGQAVGKSKLVRGIFEFRKPLNLRKGAKPMAKPESS